MKLHLISLGVLCFIASNTYAFFCPTNFTLIDVGASIGEVTAACGKPDTQEKKEVTAEGAQEWSYFVSQPVMNNGLTTVQGSLKTQMSFDTKGKLINISVNGIGVGATTICGPNVQLGDSRDSVKQACGQPGFINTQTNPAITAPPKKTSVITYIYNTSPPMKLIFEDGILVRKE